MSRLSVQKSNSFCRYKNTEALDILSKLETDGLFSPTKPEGLIEIARDANRPDLASEVEKFIKSQRKTASKQEKKSHKQLKGAPQAAAESDMDLHLKANFEVTLSQATVLIKQVDVLEQAITAGKGCRHRVEEAMTEARQTAERLAQTLQKAQRKLESDSGSDRSSADLSPTADENKDWGELSCLCTYNNKRKYNNTSLVLGPFHPSFYLAFSPRLREKS